MKNYYSEIDEVTLTFSDIHTTTDGMEYIRIYFERPTENGFDFLESTIPSLRVKESAGFSSTEIQEMLRYAQANAFLMWDIAREHEEGGELRAASV